jgi:hypothetical protein
MASVLVNNKPLAESWVFATKRLLQIARVSGNIDIGKAFSSANAKKPAIKAGDTVVASWGNYTIKATGASVIALAQALATMEMRKVGEKAVASLEDRLTNSVE